MVLLSTRIQLLDLSIYAFIIAFLLAFPWGNVAYTTMKIMYGMKYDIWGWYISLLG